MRRIQIRSEVPVAGYRGLALGGWDSGPREPKRPERVRASYVVKTRPERFDVYQSDTGWAKNLEIVSDIPTKGGREVLLNVPADYAFLLAAVAPRRGSKSATEPDLTMDIWMPANLHSDDEKNAFPKRSKSPKYFVHLEIEKVVLGIIQAPRQGQWRVVVWSKGQAPFSIYVSAFNTTALRKEASTYSQMPIPFRDRACLITSKALGVALTVAARLSQMPPLLIEAFASFLDVETPVAKAFIDKVYRESADAIAKKLCEGIHQTSFITNSLSSRNRLWI
jgi:hypothetical protein